MSHTLSLQAALDSQDQANLPNHPHIPVAVVISSGASRRLIDAESRETSHELLGKHCQGSGIWHASRDLATSLSSTRRNGAIIGQLIRIH